MGAYCSGVVEGAGPATDGNEGFDALDVRNKIGERSRVRGNGRLTFLWAVSTKVGGRSPFEPSRERVLTSGVVTLEERKGEGKGGAGNGPGWLTRKSR